MTQDSSYHKIIRVSAVICSFVLVFVSGLIDDSTTRLSQDTHQYLANAVGAAASVEPTELNRFTAALTEKQRDLDVRESELREREIAVNISGGEANSDTATYILASILFILLVLILLNYALDYLRMKEESLTRTV